ncbi:hypothetical protein ACGTJS_13010 [Faucicola mancuniensis]|uniref:hypothetical protein n=1 Tax=Faucicola mancuniensis TaxID=1309795 RepID=UPI00397758F4
MLAVWWYKGDTIIRSKNGNITGTAATIHSEDGTTYLKADNGDISFKEGRETNNVETASRSTQRNWLSKKTNQDNYSYNNDLAIKGSINGNRVIIDAKNNVHLTATDAISQQGTYIKGGKNVTIDARLTLNIKVAVMARKNLGYLAMGVPASPLAHKEPKIKTARTVCHILVALSELKMVTPLSRQVSIISKLAVKSMPKTKPRTMCMISIMARW